MHWRFIPEIHGIVVKFFQKLLKRQRNFQIHLTNLLFLHHCGQTRVPGKAKVNREKKKRGEKGRTEEEQKKREKTKRDFDGRTREIINNII